MIPIACKITNFSLRFYYIVQHVAIRFLQNQGNKGQIGQQVLNILEVLGYVKATCNGHTWSLFTANLCVTIVTVKL